MHIRALEAIPGARPPPPQYAKGFGHETGKGEKAKDPEDDGREGEGRRKAAARKIIRKGRKMGRRADRGLAGKQESHRRNRATDFMLRSHSNTHKASRPPIRRPTLAHIKHTDLFKPASATECCGCFCNS